MTEKRDDSFADDALMGTERWCAATLGVSLDWFYRKRKDLEADGFPRKDALIGRTNKADVNVWIARRRRLADASVAPGHTTGANTTSGVNDHAL